MKKFTLFLTLAVAMANMPVAAMQTAKNVVRDVVSGLTDGVYMGPEAPVVAPEAEQQAAAPKSANSEDGSYRAGAEELKEFRDAINAGKASAARKAKVLKGVTVAAKGAKTCGKYTAATTALVATGAAAAAGLAYWYAPAESCAKAAEFCATSGNMVCQKAMTTCAPYLAQVQPTFMETALAFLRHAGLTFGF